MQSESDTRSDGIKGLRSQGADAGGYARSQEPSGRGQVWFRCSRRYIAGVLENDEVSSAALFLFVLAVPCWSECGGGDLPDCFSLLKIKTNLWTGLVWYTEAARGPGHAPGRHSYHEHSRKERLSL